MSKIVQLSIISVALLSQLQAENTIILKPIQVTSSQGVTLNKKDVTDSVTVITKEAIEESHVSSLTEALSKLGNVTMSQSGGTGQQASLFVRGMDTRRVLILIDGVRYNNPTAIGGVAELSQIMLYNVEQIEIVKGSQSGVWGSDASGAVINIITSKAKKGLHALANIEYGSFSSKKSSIQASFATDKYDILVGGLFIDNDGFSAVEPTKSDSNYGKRYDELGLEKDAYQNRTFNAKLGFNITKKDRLEASVQIINSDIQIDSGAGATNDSSIPSSQVKNSFYALNYKHSGTIHTINLNSNLSTFDKELELVNFSGVGTTFYNYKGSVNEIKVDDKIKYLQDSFLRLGASYQSYTYEKQTGTEDKSYNAIAAFVTNYNKLQLFSNLDTIITESVRYDRYDEFKNALTGKFGAKQFIYKDYYVSTNIGTGFNAPTIGQVYGQYGSVANPNIEPETSLTTDITLGNDTLWITAFYNSIDKLITYNDPDGFAGPLPAIYENLDGKSKFKGFELGYEDYFFDTLNLGANYTYVKTEDATGKEFARRPKSQLDVKATYYLSQNYDFGLNAQYIGERYDSADKQGAQTGKYIVTNFIANAKVNRYFALYGKINNITDKYYQVVDGYATAGRSFYVGLTAKY